MRVVATRPMFYCSDQEIECAVTGLVVQLNLYIGFSTFKQYLKFENSLFFKLHDIMSVQAAPGSVSMSQYTVNPFPAAS